MTEVPIAAAPGRLAELLRRACEHGERVFLTQDGRRVAALISITELSLFEEIQAHDDLQDALAATSETTPTDGIPPGAGDRGVEGEAPGASDVVAVPYQVQLSPPAHHLLGALPDDLQMVFLSRLERPAADPRPPEATCLATPQQICLVRIGDGTVVYRLYDTVQLVYVTRLRWRGLSI
jgi:prevent-host-death family protein